MLLLRSISVFYFLYSLNIFIFIKLSSLGTFYVSYCVFLMYLPNINQRSFYIILGSLFLESLLSLTVVGNLKSYSYINWSNYLKNKSLTYSIWEVSIFESEFPSFYCFVENIMIDSLRFCNIISNSLLYSIFYDNSLSKPLIIVYCYLTMIVATSIATA